MYSSGMITMIESTAAAVFIEWWKDHPELV
jgi:hypothetical protein